MSQEHQMEGQGSNMSGSEVEAILGQLSDEMAVTLLPVLLMMGLIMLLGALGNALVFFIYYTRFQPCSTRSAILALAGLDLTTCALGIPGEIVDLRFSFNFYNDFLCRSLRTVTTVNQVASGLVLVVVALDRFQRICHPLREQLSALHAWRRVGGVCVLAVLLSIPAPVVYGLSPVDTDIPGVQGLECSSSHSVKGTVLPLMYALLHGLVFLCACTTMTTLYVMLGRQLLRQDTIRSTMHSGGRPSAVSMSTKHLVDRPRRPATPSRSDGESDERPANTNGHDGNQNPSHHHASSITILGEEPADANGDIGGDGTMSRPSTLGRGRASKDSSHEADLELDLPSNVSGQSRIPPSSPTSPTGRLGRQRSFLSKARARRKSTTVEARRTRKTTLMLAFITAVFIVSFLPHLVLKGLQATNKGFVNNMSTAGFVAYNIFVRSYFFNTAINFFIYGSCSPRFRTECRRLFLRWSLCARKRRVSLQGSDML